MADYDAKQIWRGRYRLRSFLFDVPLLTFLLVGWTIVFIAATLGLQRTDQQWLPVSLISPASADYSVDPTEAPRPAPIKPEIIEAIKQDQILQPTATPQVVALADTATSTLEPTAALVPVPGALEVSAGGPYHGQEGREITVTAGTSGSVLGWVPGAMAYLWDLDNDGRFDDARGASTSLIFYNEGIYPISVQATDLLGRVGVDTTTVTVINAPPSLVMGNDLKAKEGAAVVFFATASDPGNDVLFYEWDFGDGSPKVTGTLNPRHTYLDDGDYTVRLVVKDNAGGVTEASLKAEIENLPPVVNAGPDQVVDEGSPITFNGTATDPSPIDALTLTYAWDFSYDGHTFKTDATGPTVSTVYPNGPASIVAALRVRDKNGGETIDTVRVTVNNVPPVITAVSNDGPVGEGSPLTLTVSATDVGNDPLSYAFDWQNDGSFDEVGPSSTVSHVWYNQGNYTVRIWVDDGDGGQAFTTTTVAIFNEPPVAIANVEANRLEGSPVAFDGSDSYDPGINDVLTYQWNFGDGQSGSGITTTHIYADNGLYNATLTVTDDSGAASTASAAVNILNANPTADAGPDLTLDEGANVVMTFHGTATDPGAADTLSYAWDFDYKNGVFDEDAAGATVTHIFSSLDGPADRIVALRVRDKDYPYPTAGGGEIGEAFDTLKLTISNLPPWNVSAGGPYVGVETQPIVLTGTAEDAPADLPSLAYAWDLDGNSDFETPGRQVTHVWNTAGNYTIRLRVRDKDGGESFASTQVTIGNAPPLAEANGPYTSTVLFPVTLSSAGSSDPTGDPLTYQWDFGDGTPVVVPTSITVTHHYTDDGIYTATLRVDDGRGGTDTDTALVTIANLPPTAVASARPNPVAKGNPVTFDGSGSTDPDDSPASLTYQWNFDDGNTAAGINVSHVYAHQGVYTTVLTVTDDKGATDTDSLVLTVNNSPPVAVAGPDQTVNEGDLVTFDGSGSGDPNPGDSLTYQWDFGDGSPVGNGVSVTYIYPNGPATYVVTLTVTDSDGAMDTDTVQVTVNNVAPTAEAGPDQSVDEGAPVTFDGSGSSDPGGDIVTYQWDFGDGSPVANGVSVTHTYPDGPATYVVTLTVTDSDGAVGTDTVQVTVNNVAPTARAAADQTTVTVGQVVNFDGSGSTDPGADTLTYQWNFGDGATGSGPAVSHAWTMTGTYTITMQVDDGDGGSDTDTLSVQVN